MIAPAALVILSPILVGSFWGVEAVVGLLAGALSSSVQLAISMSNTGVRATPDTLPRPCPPVLHTKHYTRNCEALGQLGQDEPASG